MRREHSQALTKKEKAMFELAANGGTIFVDELENMTPYAQSKFLTVIEERKIHPLGSAEYKGHKCPLYFRNKQGHKAGIGGKTYQE